MGEPSGVDCVPMGDALAPRMPGRTFGSKRLLALAGDDRLVAADPARERAGLRGRVRAPRRRHPRLLPPHARLAARRPRTPCSTPSPPPSGTFSAATSARSRSSHGSTRSRATAACRCCARAASSRLSSRSFRPRGSASRSQRRAELRELLADLRELPEEQRAALLLAEAADLSHAEVAGVLGCEVARVKALVFRARSGLIERRDARETPCARDPRAAREPARRRAAPQRAAPPPAPLPGMRAYRDAGSPASARCWPSALPVAPTAGAEVERARGGGHRRRRRGGAARRSGRGCGGPCPRSVLGSGGQGRDGGRAGRRRARGRRGGDRARGRTRRPARRRLRRLGRPAPGEARAVRTERASGPRAPARRAHERRAQPRAARRRAARGALARPRQRGRRGRTARTRRPQARPDRGDPERERLAEPGAAVGRRRSSAARPAAAAAAHGRSPRASRRPAAAGGAEGDATVPRPSPPPAPDRAEAGALRARSSCRSSARGG